MPSACGELSHYQMKKEKAQGAKASRTKQKTASFITAKGHLCQKQFNRKYP